MSHKLFATCNVYTLGKPFLVSGINPVGQFLHKTSSLKFPQATALKLPTNVVDINASETGRFSPLRERDVSGAVINSYYEKQGQRFPRIDITVKSDPYANKYDCRGAVNLSSSMQSNVPSPFSGNHTHLGMPGSQWGQGYKYLSDHLHGAHYLTLRNEYREKAFSKAVAIGRRDMSTNPNPPLTAKDKLKKAVKEYGSTVIIFHVSVSLFSLGGCYLLVSSGVDIVSILQKWNIGEGVITKLASSNAGTFVMAYAIHKVFAPLRIAMTLSVTPFIVRYLRNIGFLKSNLNSGGGK